MDDDAVGAMSDEPNLSVAIRTLVTGGFTLERAHRHPGYSLLQMRRADEFGAEHKYAFAIAESSFGENEIAAAKIAARPGGDRLILVGDVRGPSDLPTIDWPRFLGLFGGAVYTFSPLESEFGSRMCQLAMNRLPEGVSGRADDLFEEYTRAALAFLLGGRVIRYGQDRRFKRRPDGLAIPRADFSALYDTKAYSGEGFPVTAESSRQFQSYIEDFGRRYRAHLPRLNTFMVISGRFVQGERALEERSREMQAVSGVPLAFLTADDLARMVSVVAEHPSTRSSVDWRRVFGDPVVRSDRLETEIQDVLKDGIVRGRC